MSRSYRQNWGSDQFLRYVIDGTLKMPDIPRWTCQHLVLYIADQLNQPSGAMATYVQGLCSKNSYESASERQQELLLQLQPAGAALLALIDMLFIWLSAKNVMACAQPHSVIRKPEQFDTYLAERHLEMQEILSWPCEQFVQDIYEELSGHATKAMNVLESLNKCGFTSDEMQDILVSCQREIDIIQGFTKRINSWLRSQKYVNSKRQAKSS